MRSACTQHLYLTGPLHASQVHPDLFQDPDARATNERSFKLLQEYLAAGLLHQGLGLLLAPTPICCTTSHSSDDLLLSCVLLSCCPAMCYWRRCKCRLCSNCTIGTLVHCLTCSLRPPSALLACRSGKYSYTAASKLTATLLHFQPPLARPVLLPYSGQR